MSLSNDHDYALQSNVSTETPIVSTVLDYAQSNVNAEIAHTSTDHDYTQCDVIAVAVRPMAPERKITHLWLCYIFFMHAAYLMSFGIIDN